MNEPNAPTGLTLEPRLFRLLAGGVVVLALAVVAQITAPDGGVPEPTAVEVAATDLSCPAVQTTSNRSARTQISAVTPSNLLSGPAGRALIGTPTDTDAFATISGGNHAATIAPPAGTGAVVGSATAGRAPGFTADQITVSTDPATHGLAGLACPQPDNDVWFIGTGSAVGHRSTLYLTDAEATPATVDVVLYGKNGRIDAPAGLGLVVKANARRTVQLDSLAPGAGVLAVHVSATAGRVGASVFDSEVRGLEPRGSDWVPSAEGPATRVVVPGVVSGQGARTLSVFAPGEGTATVQVRLIGREGGFAPSGAASVEIDRGKVSTVDLGAAAVTDDVAVLVQSPVPVVAGVRRSATAGSVDDLAFTAGSSPLTAPAVVTGLYTDNGYGSTLMFTAPDGAATVQVQPLRNGKPYGKPTTVKVGAERTVRVGFPKGVPQRTGGVYAAVLTPQPESGPVHVALVRTKSIGGAAGLTLSVVRDARITVGVPEAQSGLDVGLGR